MDKSAIVVSITYKHRESAMLTVRSWDELTLPGTFQNSCREEIAKVKNGNFHISAIIILVYNIYVEIYVFDGDKHNRIRRNILLNIKRDLLDIKRVEIQD